MGLLLDAAKQLQEDAFLHIEVAKDTRGQRLGQLGVQVLVILHEHDRVLLLFGELIQIFLVLLLFRTADLLLSKALI